MQNVTWPYATSAAAAATCLAAKACQRASYRARRTPTSPCKTQETSRLILCLHYLALDAASRL